MQPITGEIQSIAETFALQGTPSVPTPGNALYKSSSNPGAFYTPSSVDASLAGTLCLNSSLVSSTACETRPMNVAMLPCIKWQVTSAPSSCGIPCNTLTGKGAIVSASATDTPLALPLGSEGSVLVVCNACSTGLDWSAPVIGSAYSCTATFIPAVTDTRIPLGNIAIQCSPSPLWINGNVGGCAFTLFRPTVSGFYQFNAAAWLEPLGSYYAYLKIRKNTGGSFQTIAIAETDVVNANPSVVLSGITYLCNTGQGGQPESLELVLFTEVNTCIRTGGPGNLYNPGTFLSGHLIR